MSSELKPSLLKDLEEVRDLPTIPQVLSELMSRMADPRHNAMDLGDIIIRDPSLAARFLRLANSAFFGLPRQVTDLTQALVYLGEQEVYKIVTTVSVFQKLRGNSANGEQQRERFWIHSISTAVLSAMMDRVLNLGHSGEAYTAGLLHDVGKIILDQYFPEQYAAVQQLAMSREIPVRQAERELLGTDHTEVGAWVAQQWNLPAVIVAGIRNHHEFDPAAENATLIGCVAFANELSHREVDNKLVEEENFWSDSHLSWERMNQIAGKEMSPLALLEAAANADESVSAILGSLK